MNDQKASDTELQKIKRDVLTRTIAAVLAAAIIGLAVGVGGAVYAFSSGMIATAARDVLLEDGDGRADLIADVKAALLDDDAAVRTLTGEAPTPQAVRDAFLEDTAARDAIRGEARTSAIVPTGAVVAFDRSCPEGWQAFTPATGRFLIGAGKPSDPKHEKWQRERQSGGVDEVQLSSYRLRESGGEENHILREEEMPKHYHSAGLFYADSADQDHESKPIDFSGNDAIYFNAKATSWVGGDSPHNNMPPYIALYFCKKTAQQAAGAQ